MTLKVTFPERMDGYGIYDFLRQLFDEKGRFKGVVIELDFSSLKFIEPVGLTCLVNTMELAALHEAKVNFANTFHKSPSGPLLRESVRYLDDAGFFKKYLDRRLDNHSERRVTSMPMQTIRHSSSHAWLESRFLSWLAGRLGVKTAEIATIKVCMQELFNNIKDHSGKDIGCFYSQHFPKNKIVHIVVSDFGRGIPQNVQGAIPGIDDASALRTAAEEGFTTRRAMGNRGVGLDLLIRKVVGSDGGRVEIRSGRGRLSCYQEAGQQVRKPRATPGFYPGTLIEVKLRADSLVRDEVDREDLEW